MQRLERLVAIHDTLRRAAPGRISAARLAEDFGVTRRTIERDLVSLRQAGVPLYAEHGRNGGQVTLDQIGPAVVALSAAEVTALLTAVAAAGPDMPFADAANSAVNRLLDGLHGSTRIAVDQLRSKVRTHVVTATRPKRRVRRTIEAAVQRGVVVSITYRDGNDVLTKRAVEAIGLYRGAEYWHLIGWCQLRKASRLFRIDRIESATLTRRPIENRDVDETLGWVPRDTGSP